MMTIQCPARYARRLWWWWRRRPLWREQPYYNVVPHGSGEVGTTWWGEKGEFYEGGTTRLLHFSCRCNTNRRDKAFGDFKRFLFIVFVKL